MTSGPAAHTGGYINSIITQRISVSLKRVVLPILCPFPMPSPIPLSSRIIMTLPPFDYHPPPQNVTQSLRSHETNPHISVHRKQGSSCKKTIHSFWTVACVTRYIVITPRSAVELQFPRPEMARWAGPTYPLS